MAATTLKVVVVVVVDQALWESVDALVRSAGCKAVHATTVEQAGKLLVRTRPVLMLFDPGFEAELGALGTDGCPATAIPVRVSSTGVRRFAKRSGDAVRWLKQLVAQQCSTK